MRSGKCSGCGGRCSGRMHNPARKPSRENHQAVTRPLGEPHKITPTGAHPTPSPHPAALTMRISARIRARCAASERACLYEQHGAVGEAGAEAGAAEPLVGEGHRPVRARRHPREEVQRRGVLVQLAQLAAGATPTLQQEWDQSRTVASSSRRLLHEPSWRRGQQTSTFAGFLLQPADDGYFFFCRFDFVGY